MSKRQYLNEPLDRRASYNHYITEMEYLRVRTGKESIDFYLSLLKIPLAQRDKALEALNSCKPKTEEESETLIEYGESFYMLRGCIETREREESLAKAS